MNTNVINELEDFAEKATHCVGWKHIHSFEDVERFLRVSTNQTHAVYITRSITYRDGEPIPLPYA